MDDNVEIYTVKDQAELNELWDYEDKNFDKNVPYEKSEWIQWLQQQIINNPQNTGIWFVKNNSKLEEYLVAFSSIAPPILQDIFVLYYTFKNPDISSIHFRMFQEIKEWGIKQKAIKISIQTKYPRFMSKFGFINEEVKSMVYLLDTEWEEV